MSIQNVTAQIGATTITIETGKLARLADGAVTVRTGDTIIMVSAVSATTIKEGQDWFPLTVDYREKAIYSCDISDRRIVWHARVATADRCRFRKRRSIDDVGTCLLYPRGIVPTDQSIRSVINGRKDRAGPSTDFL